MKKNHENSPVSAATDGTNRLTKVYNAVVGEQTTNKPTTTVAERG
jgi:hypothetical protein